MEALRRPWADGRAFVLLWGPWPEGESRPPSSGAQSSAGESLALDRGEKLRLHLLHTGKACQPVEPVQRSGDAHLQSPHAGAMSGEARHVLDLETGGAKVGFTPVGVVIRPEPNEDPPRRNERRSRGVGVHGSGTREVARVVESDDAEALLREYERALQPAVAQDVQRQDGERAAPRVLLRAGSTARPQKR